MQPPSSYLSFYIFLFNGFIQGDHVVSCTKKNLHHYYRLHLQNWTALKIYFKEVWGYFSFVLEQPNPVSHKHKPNCLHLWGEHSKHLCFDVFHDCGCWCCWLLFKPFSGYQFKASVTLLLTSLPQEESRNSVLIYILREMI